VQLYHHDSIRMSRGLLRERGMLRRMEYVSGWERQGTPAGPAPAERGAYAEERLVPMGDRHAVVLGATTSLCGREMGYVSDSSPWAEGGLGARCRECIELTRNG